MNWKQQFDSKFIYDPNSCGGIIYNNGEDNSSELITDEDVKDFIQEEIIEKLIADCERAMLADQQPQSFIDKQIEQLRKEWL